MTVIVNVWLPWTCLGHCSLNIGTDTYISFYPSHRVSTKDSENKKQKKSSFTKTCYETSSHDINESYEEDCEELGDEDVPRKANRRIHLDNLDEELMKKYWLEIRTQKLPYRLLWRNCASVIAEALKLGYHSYAVSLGKSEYEILLNSPHYLPFWQPWTPESLSRYAFELKAILESINE